MSIFEIHRNKAERMTTEKLQRDLAYYERKLEVTGREVDCYIRQDSEKLALTIDALTAECRSFATIIRAISEELGLRGVA